MSRFSQATRPQNSRDILAHWKTFPLSLENKLLIYKTVLQPVWTYGIELWGCATNSNIAVIQRYQTKLLRTITNAPWYGNIHLPKKIKLQCPLTRNINGKQSPTTVLKAFTLVCLLTSPNVLTHWSYQLLHKGRFTHSMPRPCRSPAKPCR